MNDIHIPSPCQLTNTQCNFQRVSKSRVTPDSYHSTLSLRGNHDRVFSFRVTPDSYHSTLSLRDNITVCFLSQATELFGLHCEPLTSTQKFWISPRVSYTHIEISDISMGLLHPHKNSGYLPGSLNTHREISDISTGLLHPLRNSGYLPGSLTPTQKFGISPRVSYTHTEISDFSPGLLHPHKNSGYLPGSLIPTQDLLDTTAGLLHLNSRLFHLRGLTSPFLLYPTHINYSSVVPKTNSTHTHQEW